MSVCAMLKPILLAAGLLATAAVAAPAAPSGISADRPWIRATPPGALTAAGYMTLNNRGPAADRLLGGSTPVARGLTIHRSVMSDGVARMSATASLAIGPGRAIAFKPGGYHLMLVGLTGPLTVGRGVPVTLDFEHAGPVTIIFKVEQGAPAADGHGMGAARDGR